MNRPPRMSDVAKLAGVGTMTVSRVLSGSVEGERGGRRGASLMPLRRLNYRPNEVARALRDQRSHQIGVIVPNLVDPSLRDLRADRERGCQGACLFRHYCHGGRRPR